MKKIAYSPANALTSVISSHEYTYQPGGNITTWKRNNGLTDTITTYGYDAADQLLSALTAATATPSVTTETFGYSYDKAGNRQSEQRDTVMAGFTFNNLNQVLSRNGGGGILVQGNTDEPAQVTVNGKSVTPAADNTFETVVPGTNGANTIAVTAKDFSPSQNTQTKSWSATMSAGATATYTYDGNGNMTGDGSRTFQWDAKNRLTRIIYSGTNASTEMAYDGLDRRVSIVEKDGLGTVVSSKAFVWNGLSIADQRIGSTISKQYFSEGWRDASAGTNYFYERDHLGSVREVVNDSSGVLTRYGYDAYGRGTKLSGTVESDFQYTGHYAHLLSGLYLAPFRAYNAELGRWISRDPLNNAEMLQGPNLYAYVANSPIQMLDPDGRDAWNAWGFGGMRAPGQAAAGVYNRTGNAGLALDTATGLGDASFRDQATQQALAFGALGAAGAVALAPAAAMDACPAMVAMATMAINGVLMNPEKAIAAAEFLVGAFDPNPPTMTDSKASILGGAAAGLFNQLGGD